MRSEMALALLTETGSRPVVSRRERQAMVAKQVWDALSRKQRELPAEFLADAEIAPLRRRVDQMDHERLLTAEGPLVRQTLVALASSASDVRSVVELLPSGTDNALEIVRAYPGIELFTALDSVSATGAEAVARFRASYPNTPAARVVTDPVMAMNIRRALPRPAVLACLGGTFGRFMTLSAIRFLRAIRAAMLPHDRLLLGVDLRTGAALEADHTRERSLREALHRHTLTVVNRECGADFDISRFRYYARYDVDSMRLNVGLESVTASVVRIPRMRSVSLPSGSTIRTAVQCTYGRRALQGMLLGAGMITDLWHENERGDYAVAAVSSVDFDARG